MTRLGLVMRGLVLAAGCAAGLVAAAVAGVIPATHRPADGGFRGAPLPAGLEAPAFALRDERGRPVSLDALRGGPAIVAFATAVCEDTCALTLQTIRGALDDVGTDVPAIAVAVDPERDTPAHARRFLVRQRVAGRIRFALGGRDELERVWRGFAVQPETATVHHQARIVLLDARGRQRVGYFTGMETSEDIAHDLRLLLAEQARTMSSAGSDSGADAQARASASLLAAVG